MKTSNVSQNQSSGLSPTGEKVQELKAAATEKARQLKDAAASTVTKAKDEAEHFATDKKRATADRIGGYGSAIHESAKALEEKDPNIAWFTHRAADRVDQVADYIRNRDFREVRADVEDIARRNPALFYGGLFVAGLLIGNVVKASRRKISDYQEDYSNDEPSSNDWAAAESRSIQPEMPAPAPGI